MISDITLGQYFPGTSAVHRLDPRTKLLAVVLYIAALFLASWFVTYAVMVFGTALFNSVLVQILTPLLRKVLKR